ncbi:precorrin-4 C11-methyltransferase [Dysgonomonas alginatilytica]|uniref:Precorrin-4 C11-methyltransferase n=1 Tax=Dysgonomonas alginatilytica TaxID=1605892 RepID=A0A2V3PQD3_9BACT|nr:precorrin-4 C(11)-methyltransferase [Dysgonomonas alginatilytica]PXV65949.1 precorrin-4 C11-methyltransferase [Dysgonomonas alginatilytica]
MTKTAIILTSESSLVLAQTIKKDLANARIYTKAEIEGTVQISSINDCVEELFNKVESLIFIGAMGICVRSIAPYIVDKYTDPAVVNIDSTGKYVVSVLSGHIGGANDLSKQVANIIGGEAVITTQSDNTNLWALDTIGKKFGWVTDSNAVNFNYPLTSFVNKKPTALLLDINDEGTTYLERTAPEHVDLYYKYEDINLHKYELLIAVTPYLYPDAGIQVIYYHPRVLHLGVGCRKDCDPKGITDYLSAEIKGLKIAMSSIKDISSIDLKKDEALLEDIQVSLKNIPVNIYSADELKDIEVPNPSQKVKEVTSVSSVSEATAIKSANGGSLILEKQKAVLSIGNDFTFAIAIDREAIRQGHIEIVGAGPGDPDLISVKGRYFLEAADLILYAGSLVPVELTYCAKQGAVVRSSASMDLEEQFAIMKEFYDKGKLVVRLHTGDPCIYGAIQEQMAFFDEYKMSYHITPGISSFLAAAAALESQFTIPEKVQTIILTRGEGRTPMPEKEKLHMLAQSQSTMCIFLSATIVDQVQEELLVHYPPTTPVAACYKLTWKDERIYRGELKDLTKIIKENNLTLTTMIVVGDAIGNREGLSKLYSHQFKHLFRK